MSKHVRIAVCSTQYANIHCVAEDFVNCKIQALRLMALPLVQYKITHGILCIFLSLMF